METATVLIDAPDGRVLGVEQGGDLSGRPILVHHGTPGSRQLSSRWLLDAQNRGVRLIGYDRPGYGASTAQPGRTVADCAEDVRTIAAVLGIDRLAVWGICGGGPHALACAALLPDLVSAVGSLASVAPYGADGLDYFSGMGQENADETRLFLNDPAAARQKSHQDRDEMLATEPDELHEIMSTLLSPADRAALTLEIATELVSSSRLGLEPGDQGWWDDAVAHMGTWGFDFADIRVPVQLWHGAQDQFVPVQHGRWLAAHIPGVDAHITETDGHITLAANRVPELHDWLLSQP